MHVSELFYPSSIAIIGASRTPKSVGNDVVKNLVHQGYQGKIYPVNPQADELYGLKVYPSVKEIPKKIDLVVVAIPAKFVVKAIEDASKKGAKAAIVISAGFKEMGNVALEQELKEVCERLNIALIGPNCLGVINPEIRMNASFAGIMPGFGNIAFISQSGALCSSVLDYAREYNLGFSKFLSIGNKACIDEVKLLEYLAEDEQTKVIAMYVEQLEDAQKFISVAKKVTQGKNPKPILILKSGRTVEGAAAIASHTGSLAGGDAAYDALFAQAGIIRPNTIRELFEFIDIFAHNPIRKVENVTIVTNAGGPGVITTDQVMQSGLTLSKLSKNTKDRLQAFLPVAASVNNPVDILGDAKADRYQQTLEVLCADPHIDALVILLTPQTMTEVEETAKAIIEIKKSCNKPMVISFMGKESVDSAIRLMEKELLSTTTFPELAVRGLAAMGQSVNHSGLPKEQSFKVKADAKLAGEIIEKQKRAGYTALTEEQALHVFDAYQLPTLKRTALLTKADAKNAMHEFSAPVALKIISPDILHKSDVGGVMLHVAPENIQSAYEDLLDQVKKNVPSAKLVGVLAVEMAPANGVELIVGAKQIPGLGTLVMVGLGGVYVEIFKDIQFGFAPLRKDFARRMIEGLQSFPILQGSRGHQGYDTDALLEILGKVSQLVTDYPSITELDMNPVLILPKGEGCRVLDARIML